MYCRACIEKEVPWTDPTGTRTYLPSKLLADDRFLVFLIIIQDLIDEALEGIRSGSVCFECLYDHHHEEDEEWAPSARK